MIKHPSTVHQNLLNETSFPGNKTKHHRKCTDIILPTKKTNEWAKNELQGCTNKLCVRVARDADMYFRAMHFYDVELAASREQEKGERNELTERFRTMEAMRRHEVKKMSELMEKNCTLEERINELEASDVQKSGELEALKRKLEAHASRNRELEKSKREFEVSHVAEVNEVKASHATEVTELKAFNRRLESSKGELEACAAKFREVETSKLQLERKVEELNEIVRQKDNEIWAMSQQIDALALVKAEETKPEMPKKAQLMALKRPSDEEYDDDEVKFICARKRQTVADRQQHGSERQHHGTSSSGISQMGDERVRTCGPIHQYAQWRVSVCERC